MTIGRGALVACLLSVGVVLPAAQNPPAQNPPAPQGQAQQTAQPQFKSRIDSVVVDVAVADKKGQPVADLTEQDFEVRENNKVQTIDTFKLVTIDDTPVAPETLPSIVSFEDQQREIEDDRNRLVVVFLDDYHTRRENSQRIRLELAKFASQLYPRDLVAVMYPLMPPTALTFSRNRVALARDFMMFEGRKYDYNSIKNDLDRQMSMGTPEQIEQQRNLIVISALQTLCAYMGTMRQGRKTLLLVSEGFTGATPSTVIGGVPGNPDPIGGANLQTEFQQIFADAARSNTSLYTLDPRGLAVCEFCASARVNMQVDLKILNTALDSLRVIADNTGGRAILNSNDPLPALKQMLRDSSAYYLLGYTSTEKPRDGRFHPIKVRVLRKDAGILYARPGYWAYSADDVAKITAPPKPAPDREIVSALDSLSTPQRGRAVQLWMGADRGADGKAIVTLAWQALTAESSQSLGTVDHVNVTATSFMGDQLFAGPVQRDPQAPLLAGRVTFEAPPGPVSVRAVAENAKGLRLDADDAELDVPDFTRVDLLITKPVVYRAGTAVDLRRIRAAASPMPAVTRDFQRSERLLIRFQAYGPAGAKVAVTARLLNQIGEPMADLPAPTALSDANFEMEMGLGTLAPAQYLIEITAAAGESKKKILLAINITG